MTQIAFPAVTIPGLVRRGVGGCYRAFLRPSDLPISDYTVGIALTDDAEDTVAVKIIGPGAGALLKVMAESRGCSVACVAERTCDTNAAVNAGIHVLQHHSQ